MEPRPISTHTQTPLDSSVPSGQGDTEHSDSHCRERTVEGTRTTIPGTSETGTVADLSEQK